MEEFDLRHLWEESTPSASAYYESIASEIEVLAQQRSGTIWERILRNSRNEAWMTLVFSLFLSYYFTIGWAITVILLSAMLLANYYAFSNYFHLKRAVQEINQDTLLEALNQYIEVLTNYVNRLHFHANFSIPFAFLSGLLAAVLETSDGLSTDQILRISGGIVLVSIPVLLLVIWLLKRIYIPWLYGQYLEELKEIKSDLEGKEEES